MDPLPAGPREHPLWQTARWLLRPIAFMEACRRRFGDAFSVRFMGFQTPMVMLSDPEAIRALYTESANGLPPGRTVALLPVMGPRSVLLLEGRDHLARRRLMLPPFHGERVQAYDAVMREIAEREVDSWSPGEPFALHPRMQAVTLEVILRAVFGVTDEERKAHLRALLPRLLNDSASVGLQFRVLASRRGERFDPLAQLRELTREIDDVLFAEIAERRTDPDLTEREDILSLLASARFEDGSAMSDEELRDQLVTLLLAGHETTATALAWTADLLVRHPDALERLHKRVEQGRGRLSHGYSSSVILLVSVAKSRSQCTLAARTTASANLIITITDDQRNGRLVLCQPRQSTTTVLSGGRRATACRMAATAASRSPRARSRKARWR